MTTTTDINEEDKKETALAAMTKEISKIQHTNNVRTNPPYKAMEVETKETLRSMERKMDGLETENIKIKETMENMKRKVDSLQAENNKIKDDMTKTSQEVQLLRTINEDLLKEIT